MYTYCKKYGNKILLREESGEPKTITKHPWELYFEDEDGKYSSVYGDRLRKSTYKTVKEAQGVLEEQTQFGMGVYGAKTFGYQYIRDKFFKKEPISPKQLYIANIDIETGRDEKGYSPPEEARCPVTSITLQNMGEDIYYVWGYNPDGYFPKALNVRYIDCRDEHDMLAKFVAFMHNNPPHIITGWYCEVYDIPYLVNRINREFQEGEDLVKKLSPFGIVNERSIKGQYGKESQTYDLIGISILDYIVLFKKFTYITPENYQLNTIAHLVLDDSKIDYSEYANLQDLFEKDYDKFIDYNIKDVNIVSRLDDKLQLFDLVFSISYKAGINYVEAVSPVTTWDVLIYNSIMDKGMIPIINVKDSKVSQYVGGYVKEPIPAMYNWIMSVDLNSLYPHIQMGINISPEKRLSLNEISPELLDIRDKLGTTVKGINFLLEKKVDTSALKTYNVALAPNGQFYKRDSDGFIPKILEGIYNERKSVKGSMLQDKQKMETNPELDLKNDIAAKDTLQKGLKILMNAEYGALANAYFRYFDIRNAEAITSTGQLAIRWVADRLNIFLNDTLSTKDVDYIIAIDTDSVYINLEGLVNKFIPTKDTTKIVDALDGWGQKVLEPKIEKIYDDLADYTNSHKQKMVMGREVIAKRGFWTGKKRYALSVYDNEGVRYTKPKVKIMGLESVRSSTPEFCRNSIKETITKILNEDEKSVQDYILEVKEDFYKQKPEDISFPRGTNDIEKWIGTIKNTLSEIMKDDDDFGEEDEYGEFIYAKKSCPIHVRGCIAYNKYLDDNKLLDEKVQSGDKIKFTYMKQPNIFHSTVISFPPAMNIRVYEEVQDMINYDKQWTGTFMKPINGILQSVGWSGERVASIYDFCEGGEDY